MDQNENNPAPAAEPKKSLRVCISGDLGSGKSQLAQGLSQHYECPIVSMGAIQRKMAAEYGMGTLEFNKFSESRPEIDLERDQALVVQAKENKRLIIDSRMAWHFISDSIKIHLLVHPIVAARRIVQAHRLGEQYTDDADAARQLRERKESENRRFAAIYGVDCDNFVNYNFVIDTTAATSESVTNLVIALIDSIHQKHARVWVAGKNLFPTQKLGQSVPMDHTDPKHLFNSPILAIRHHTAFYIYDGHKRVFDSISQGIAFTPVILIESEAQMYQSGASPTAFAHAAFSRENAHDWEKALGFQFEYYPA